MNWVGYADPPEKKSTASPNVIRRINTDRDFGNSCNSRCNSLSVPTD
jgi:hypothetical protein